MQAFRYYRPRSIETAAMTLSTTKGAVLKAAGIDLLDRMKEGVDKPSDVVGLVDVEGLAKIGPGPEGQILIGASATLADLAENKLVCKLVPILAEAAAEAASPQLRHRATVAGNLCQHTRCGYYRHASFPCVKRGGHCPVSEPGGVRDFAGVVENGLCASAHPSSIAPVLGALGARIHLHGAKGARAIEFDALYAAPAKGRASDTALAADEVITQIEIPPRERVPRLGYAEIRQKAAHDWPLACAAVLLDITSGVVEDAAIWLGSVAPTPWRAAVVEKAIVGKAFDPKQADELTATLDAVMTPLEGTAWRVQLARVALKRALLQAGKDAR